MRIAPADPGRVTLPETPSPENDRGLDELAELVRALEANPEARQARTDARNRSSLIAALVARRREAHVSQVQLAKLLDLKQPAISELENERVDPRLSTLQRYARAIGGSLHLTLDAETVTGFRAPTASDDIESDLSGLLNDVHNDRSAASAYEDAYRRASLMDSLVKRRKSQKFTQRDIALSLGTIQSAISDLEARRTDPRFSTLQRYCRAINSELRATLDGIGIVESIIGGQLPVQRAEHSEIMITQAVKNLVQSGIEHVLRSTLTQAGRAPSQSTTAAPDAYNFLIDGTKKALSAKGWLESSLTASGYEARLTLRSGAPFFIGASIRRDHVRGVLTDLSLTMIEESIALVPLSDTSPQSVVGAITELVKQVQEKAAGAVAGGRPRNIWTGRRQQRHRPLRAGSASLHRG